VHHLSSDNFKWSSQYQLQLWEADTAALLWLVLQAYEILKGLPSLVDVPVPKGTKLTVCGDVHGQYFDLLNIFDINGLPSQENPYLFNGQYCG